MTADAQAIEDEIVAKGLTAPRITKQQIDETIAAAEAGYYIFPGTTVTVCCLTLPNGYNLIGHSACASPENFDAEIGRKLAHDRAAQQLWELEGYRLRCELAA